MGQLLHPDNYEFKGPWLLEKKDFAELEEILTKIDTALRSIFQIEIEQAAKEQYPSLQNEEFQKKVAKLKEHYPYNRIHRHVYLKAKNSTKLVGETLGEILKDRNLNSFSPNQFHANFQYGNNLKFTLDINRYSGKLAYEVNCFDQKANDEVKDLIDQWIEKNKPKNYVSFWSNNGDILFLLLPLLLGIFGSRIFLETDNSYNDTVKHEACIIIKHGVDSSNIQKAVETILKLQSNYVPENYVPNQKKSDTIYLRIFLFLILLLIAAIIRPPTLIGLGRNKAKLSFYRVWIRTVTITVPALLVVGPFLNKIQEWWTS